MTILEILILCLFHFPLLLGMGLSLTSVCEGCDCDTGPCDTGLCTASPQEYQVIITGVANGTFPCCTDYNGTFVLEYQAGSSSASECWFWVTAGAVDCIGLNQTPSLRQNATSGAVAVRQFSDSSCHSGGVTFDLTASPRDCLVGATGITGFTNNACSSPTPECDFSGASVDVTAL